MCVMPRAKRYKKEKNMEQKEFDAMMEAWLERQASAQEPGKELDWACRVGIAEGTRPRAFVTRGEAAAMLYHALQYFFAQIIGMLQEE